MTLTRIATTTSFQMTMMTMKKRALKQRNQPWPRLVPMWKTLRRNQRPRPWMRILLSVLQISPKIKVQLEAKMKTEMMIKQRPMPQTQTKTTRMNLSS